MLTNNFAFLGKQRLGKQRERTMPGASMMASVCVNSQKEKINTNLSRVCGVKPQAERNTGPSTTEHQHVFIFSFFELTQTDAIIEAPARVQGASITNGQKNNSIKFSARYQK